MAAKASGRLAGKRALLTGAGGLLGGDLARAFAAEGADLVLTSRTAARLTPLADELRAAGRRVEAATCDFTDQEAIDQLAEAAWQAFGGIDVVLLSSQPAEPHMGTLLNTSEADYLEQHQTIVWGPLRLMRTLAPRMMAAGGGSVITTISSTGIEPVVGYSAYGLAKGSLALLTRYMAQEWGKGGIRVNAWSPGTVATGEKPEVYEAMLRERGMLARTALGRAGRNRDCLGLAIYLASDESAFTSGQQVFIDGGRF